MAKVAVWSGFALLALLWSGAAWALGAGLQWGIDFVGSGAAADVGAAVAKLPIPAWLTYWIDVRAIGAAMEGIVWAIEGLQTSWPWIAGALGWLVPLVWIGWGLGMVVLLTMAGAGHLMIARFTRPTPAPAT